MNDDLTDRDRQMLDFERQWWKHPGAKEAEIRSRFGISATRYYQQLNALLDQQAALTYDPMLIKRLHRIRDARRAGRRRPHGATGTHR